MIRALVFALILNWPLWVGSAEDKEKAPLSAVGNGQPTQLELLTAATTGVLYLIPGVGLNAARLGDRLDMLVADWGRPDRQRKSGVIRRTVELSYQLDDFTVIHFRGQRRLQQIAVEGLPGSTLQTAEGALFGIEPQQLIQIYGHPTKAARDGKIEYPSLGIGFAFEDNRLRRIAVFPAVR